MSAPSAGPCPGTPGRRPAPPDGGGGVIPPDDVGPLVPDDDVGAAPPDDAAAIVPDDVGAALRRLRDRRPLVQCLTNVVAAQRTADVLLAVGATAAMVDGPDEAEGFAAVADGVLVNLGTPRAETTAGIAAAVAGATAAGTPWVLDPVAVGALPRRTATLRDLLAGAAPTVLRGNPSEVLAVAGGRGGRGPETVDATGTAAAAAHALAATHRTVVAVSGPTDVLTDGVRTVRVTTGTELLTRVTGAGCALGALMAAFCAVTDDALLAATAATATLTVASETAAHRSAGPGTFAVALLDELSLLTPETLTARTRLEVDR